MALILGDVDSKSQVVAQCVPQVLHALRLILSVCAETACALSQWNRYLCGLGPPTVSPVVTLSLAVVDVGVGTALCACAGSETPLILRAGGSVEAVNAGIRGLGADMEWTCREVDFFLGEGDALLMTTDGLTKAQHVNVSGHPEILSYEGMTGLALNAFGAGGPPGRMARSVLSGAKAFSGGRFHDDATVLVAIRQ